MPDYDSDALALLVQLRGDYPDWRVTRAGTSTWIATSDTSPTASRTIAAHDLERLAERLEAAETEAEGVTWLPSRH